MKFLAAIAITFLAIPALTQDILIAVQKDGKWGYVNITETFVIPAKYDDAWPFYDGKAVASENKSFGIIDTKGTWLVAPRKGQANGDIAGKRLVCSNEQNKWGALDLKGNTVVEFSHDAMSAFQSGMAITGMKSTNPELFQINVVDTLGKPVITFDNIYLPVKSLNAGKKVREGFLNILVTGEYEKVLTASPMKIDGKSLFYALLDIKNKRLVNIKIPSLNSEVKEGRLNIPIGDISYSWSVPLASEPVAGESKFSFYSPTIFPFSGGIAAVQKDGKWAFLDKDGSLISETNLPVTDYLNEQPLYSGGFVIFTKKDGEGIYTDLKGTQRIALEFDELYPFQVGAAVVKTKGKYGLINKDGTWAVQPVYDKVRY